MSLGLYMVLKGLLSFILKVSVFFLSVLCKQTQDIETTAQIQPLSQPSLPPPAALPAPQGAPSVEELIQQSQWNLQQQEQHLLAMRQVGLRRLVSPADAPSGGCAAAGLHGLER